MSRTKAAVGLLLWVGFLVTAYFFLHSLSARLPIPAASSLAEWSLNSSNQVIALTVLRVVLMGVVVYLALAVALATLAEISNFRWLHSASRIPGVGTRRLVRNALGVSLVVVAASPALSSSASATPTSTQQFPVLHHVAPGEQIKAPIKAQIFVESQLPVEQEGTVITAPTSTETWTAIRGDNLWMIARRTLINRGLKHSTADVNNYLQILIDANRDQLLHGSPDLIFPGQIFVLPQS